MNTIKKARSHDTVPRVRKRNSTGSKPTSHGTLNAAQRRSSLLKNNRNLALTLQETRCELSVYKDFFEESQDYMNKAKLAKSRMVQLSAAIKNFVKAFDENILLLDFDELKWPNIKVSAQSNKNFQNGMNPVIELCNEIIEEVSADQEMNCNEKKSPEYSDQIVQNPSNTLQKAADEEKHFDSKRASKSPRKKSEGFVKNNNLELYSETRDAEGNEDIPMEASNSQQKHPDSNSQNPLPAPLSSQRVKTKIPRCQPLSVNLKKQNSVKESKLPNKASKRKSFDKKYEESDPNFSRRKTFVVKSNNVLTESKSDRNVTDENGPLSKERLNVPEDGFVSKNDKRKTFVVKNNNILKETEPVLCLNKIDEELVGESRDCVSENTNIQDMLTLEKNKRKTFVKKTNDKTILHQNDDIAAYRLSFPIRECAVNLEPVENHENSDQSENIKSSVDFHHSETCQEQFRTTVKSKQTCAESSKKIELNAEVSSLNMNMISGLSSKEIIKNDKVSTTDELDSSDKTEVTAKNLKSKADQNAAGAAEKDIDIRIEGLIFNDKPQKDENSNKVPELSPLKTRRSFFESSESEIDLQILNEFDFGDKRPAFKTTPIRRKIPKNKKKKFIFDGNKRISETGDNCSQKNMEVSYSDVNAVNNNEIEVDEIKKRNDIGYVSDENRVNIPSENGTVRKKTAKASNKKIKSSQITSIKNNTEKSSTKLKKVKNSRKNECFVEIDDLISQPKKIKKKNMKKKKKEDNCDDDNAISKFVEVDKVVKLNEVKETERELESDFPCKKTGKNTFLVHAEIHPPPPSFNVPDIKVINKEDDKLNLQHMQVAVVLNDVLKSKNFEFLNISDRDLLCSRAVSVKSSLSGSSSSFAIDPEESIEKLRCDPVVERDDCDLHTDAILDIDHSDAESEPVSEIENPRVRRRKPVSYKEPNLIRKMRRY